MSYVWFNNVLHALGKRINFESISCLYGNSFAKDASKYVQAANPLIKEIQNKSNIMDLAANIKIIDSKKGKEETIKSLETQLKGDLSWAEGLFKEK